MRPITHQQQRSAIASLAALFAERGQREQSLQRRETELAAAVRREFDDQASLAQHQFAARQSLLERQYQEDREKIFRQYETAGFKLALEEERTIADLEQQHAEQREAGKALCQHQCQKIQQAYKTQSVRPRAEYVQFKQQADAKTSEIRSLIAHAQKVVRRRCEWPREPPRPPAPPSGLASQQYVERYAAALARAYQQLNALQNLRAARFVEDGWPVLVVLFALPVLAYPAWLLCSAYGWGWVLAATLGPALLLGIACRQFARPLSRRQTLRLAPDFQLATAAAEDELAAAVPAAHEEGERRHKELSDERHRDLDAARNEWKRTRRSLKLEHAARVERAAAAFAARREAIEEKYERQFQELEERHPPQLAKLQQEYAAQTAERAEQQRQRHLQSETELAGEWQALAEHWSTGLSDVLAELQAMNAACDDRFPAWAQTGPAGTQPDEATAVRFGRSEVRLDQLPGGLPPAGRLQAPPAAVWLPAVLCYPERPSLLLEAEGPGRDAATRTLQAVMLRLLTTFPPGKVRFTIIDPVGLGQNFSAFMHLADYDPRLVTNRIWTETAHINQRLADLTEHMENVIQKYLRNEFASIQEYNADAGEVAEPYQILVVANFPANFSDEAARRLASIAASGARCGVYTLISTDQKLKLPRNFDLADLEQAAATLAWDEREQRFSWRDESFQSLRLTLEEPPGDERFTALVKAVGQRAKETARVEVPFEAVLPKAGDWWQGDSRHEVEVPLGRAGAKKLQLLRLGKGTSQHVLIAGKTGSGKSTLLNALITNLAAHYSPSELHFYLIDFKKGVEFKAYAAHALPHARVIAIESEREFGLSALERLDVELKHRGDLLRQAGVQDLAAYRNAKPAASMPRILLVIDEFQEFFTSDDKISHDAALLLDRLVRQGRAFGIHVLLGSQTLAGAYSLARSTLGQMAVRIALQCSETDAHLILSEDNTAARLLNRPGEAIYNDANGLLEGNHPFQVVWLSDHQRESYLRRAAEMARERGLASEPATIFEGNVAADPSANLQLRAALQTPAQPSAVQRAWLGAAVAIKDPTSATFRRQTGSNLLVVGQQEELVQGMLSSAVIALSAQSGGAARFTILDGAVPDSPAAGFWTRFSGQVPVGAKVVAPRDAAQAIREVAAEVDRRMAAGEASGSPIYLVIHHLARFRELKKSDDFGMSFDDPPAKGADKQLAAILREGPAVGVHTLAWCDSYANVSRWLDRQAVRDFDQRVLLQMSASDSSQLMDSPAASKLGTHLAFYFSEELGRVEKFRPYAIPATEWLDCISEQLAASIAAEKRPDPVVVN